MTRNTQWIDQWKVMVTYLINTGAQRPRRLFQTIELLPPKHICTETYLIAGAFSSQIEAENLLAYLKTRFVQFLVSSIASTQHLTKGKFKFVPVQDFTETWTDKKLYRKYNLTPEEIAFIEQEILPH